MIWIKAPDLVINVFLLTLAVRDIRSLKNVSLTLEPSIVQQLNESTLMCTYNLENETLYNVKWYRGIHEFYRHTPSENPQWKVFEFEGARVDASRSNATQVVLTKIESYVSGKFTCEVTSETRVDSENSSPNIHAHMDSKTMTVVQLPERPPEINIHGEPFDLNDILEANCTSYPSRPPAELRFELNGIHVSAIETVSSKDPHACDWSDLQLVMKLTDFYFKSDGKLILKCIAEIPPIYREVAELELESVRGPVFARVSAQESTSSNKESSRGTIFLLIIFLIYFYML